MSDSEDLSSEEDFSASEEEYKPTYDDNDTDTDTDVDTEVDSDINSRVEKVIKVTKPTSFKSRKFVQKKSIKDDDDSDSSVENYLVNPNEIDLASDFFKPGASNLTTSCPAPSFDCNIGLNLSDSDEEVIGEVSPSKPVDFNVHQNFNKNLERAKEHLKNFQSTNFNQGNEENDVNKLLALGEAPSAVPIKLSRSKKSKNVEISDESDWEEVHNVASNSETKKDLEVRIGPTIKKKVDKHQAEIEASIKRQINRRKKDVQVLLHKAHLICWIAHGNFVNKVLNSTKLMEMVNKFIPSNKCYPKDRTDAAYFEQIIKWYKTIVGLKSTSQYCKLQNLPSLATSLALQMQTKTAICKKDYVFIFIVLLRSMGIPCRLIINLPTLPIRPPSSELLAISTKAQKEKEDKQQKNVKSLAGKGKSKDKKVKKSQKSDLKVPQLDGGVDEKEIKELKDGLLKLDSATKAVLLTTRELNRRSKSLSDSKDIVSESLATKKKGRKKSKLILERRRSISLSSSNDVATPASRKSKRMPQLIKLKLASQLKPLTSTKDSRKIVNDSEIKPSKVTTSRRRSKSLSDSKDISSESLVTKTKAKKGDDSDKKESKPMSERQRSLSVGTSNDVETSKSTKSRKKPQLIKLKLPFQSKPLTNTKDSDKVVNDSRRIPNKSITSRRRSKSLSNAKDISSEPLLTKTKAKKGDNSDKKKSKPMSERQRSLSVGTSNDVETSESTKSRKKPQLIKLKLPFQSKPLTSTKDSDKIVNDSSRIPNKSITSRRRSKSLSDTKDISSESLVTKTKSKKENSSDKKESKTISGLRRSLSLSSSNNVDTTELTKSRKKPQLMKLKHPLQTKHLTSTKDSDKIANESREIPNKSTSSRRSKSVSDSNEIVALKSIKSKKKTDDAVSESSTTAKKISDDLATGSGHTSKKRSCVSSTEVTVAKKMKIKMTELLSKSTTPIKTKRKEPMDVSSDSDFVASPPKQAKLEKTPQLKSDQKSHKRIDRRILSTDDESTNDKATVSANDMNYWIEVYCETEQSWMCIDLFKLKVNSIEVIKKSATKPMSYVFGWNNNNYIKDVSSRYCSNWHTTTRKQRVESEWLYPILRRFKEPSSAISKKEDKELNKIHLNSPLPTSIAEFKNHPLYVLKRHLLKFEGIYPPNPPTQGFIRGEPIYPRECVHTLHSREIWVKQARVVKPGETAYKIVKARPKWDRVANKMLECQPLEIFGIWQTQPYEPPTAENGIVPRNAYGNVELFKPEMLPKNTVHLQLPGLNRICAKLKIDCAQAVVGFDFHGGSSHPTFDGFVVCEEFAELVTAKWIEDKEEAEQKAIDKRNQRIYDNWKKLIKGLLIRQRLERKYNFAGKDKTK